MKSFKQVYDKLLERYGSVAPPVHLRGTNFAAEPPRVDEEVAFEGAYVSGTEEVEPQPDLSQLEGSFQAKKDPSVEYKWRVAGPGKAGKGETIPSLEKNEQGQYVQNAPPGNIIITGLVQTQHTPNGEEWSQEPDNFNAKYVVGAQAEDKQSGVAKGNPDPNPVLMKQMSRPFKVHTSWANLDGDAGDLLTMYGPNDYGVLKKDPFNAYYIKASEDQEQVRIGNTTNDRFRRLRP